MKKITFLLAMSLFIVSAKTNAQDDKKENVLLNTICLSQIFNRKIIQLPMRTGYI